MFLSKKYLYSKGKHYLQNVISKQIDVVLAVTATLDALAERQPSLLESASLLCNRMKKNIAYGHERMRAIAEKESEEEAKQQQLDDG